MHLVLATAMAAAVCDAACAFAPGLSLRWAPSSLRSSVSLPLCAPVRRRGCALKCELAGEEGEREKALGTKVKCIFSDVDGTLLDKQHRLQPETRQAIVDAMAAGIPFVMATGKSRGPWVQEVRQQLGYTDPTGYSLNGPGVFIQGLLVCDVHGKPVQQLTLSANVIAVMNSFAAQRQIALVAYTSDDRIVCAKTDEHTDQIIPFNEPVPQAISTTGMSTLAAPGQPCVYKMMLMGPENVLAATRADLEQALAGIATVTKAMDDMLEILPLGASKWSGVSKGLDMLGLTPADCLVMGDGENDLEMLRNVASAGGVAVAVGNAVPSLKAVASYVSLKDHDRGAAAEAIRRFALGQ